MGHYSSFVVRLWIDPAEGFRWGIVQHVSSHKELRFSSFRDMLDFMARSSNFSEVSLPFALDPAGPVEAGMYSPDGRLFGDTGCEDSTAGQMEADRQAGKQTSRR